ncbi:MAG: WD40 repeat domain-containing protein [Candidatus Sigynarchaeota archaeon]
MDEECEDVTIPGKWGELERAARASKGRYPIHRYNGDARGPTALCFSRDSALVANGACGHVGIRDAASGKVIGNCRWNGSVGEKGYSEYKDGYMKHFMQSLAFSPDGRYIFAGDSRGNVYAWDVATTALRWDHRPGLAHGSNPMTGTWGYPSAPGTNAVAVSPDGRIVASGGNDGHVKAWEARTGALVADVEMATAGRPWVPWPDTDPHRVWTYPYTNAPQSPRAWFCVYSLAFSPDGRWLACGMGGANDIRDAVYAIDTRTWAPRSIAKYINLKHPYPRNPKEILDTYGQVDVLDFSPNGRWLASSGVEGVRLYKIPAAGTAVAAHVNGGGGKESESESEWKVGEVVGYDYWSDVDGDEFRGWATQGRFVNDKVLALLLEGGFIQLIEIYDDEGGWKEKAVIDIRCKGDVFSLDKVLAASPDGRWLAAGRDTGFSVVDIGTLAR